MSPREFLHHVNIPLPKAPCSVVVHVELDPCILHTATWSPWVYPGTWPPSCEVLASSAGTEGVSALVGECRLEGSRLTQTSKSKVCVCPVFSFL